MTMSVPVEVWTARGGVAAQSTDAQMARSEPLGHARSDPYSHDCMYAARRRCSGSTMNPHRQLDHVRGHAAGPRANPPDARPLPLSRHPEGVRRELSVILKLGERLVAPSPLCDQTWRVLDGRVGARSFVLVLRRTRRRCEERHSGACYWA